MTGETMRVDLPYLCERKDRHGKWRLYVRKDGKCKAMKAKPGTPEFAEEYNAKLGQLGRVVKEVAPRGTLGWLAREYFAGARFNRLDPRSQRTRRSVIERALQEPVNEKNPKPVAFLPLAKITTRTIQALVDRRQDKPGAANNRLKYLGSMLSWGARQGHIKANPARDAERVERTSDGFHTWSIEEVRQYEARHPVGTKARLALALLLFTGARRQDVVTLGRQHVRDGWLKFVPQKTLYKRATPVTIPFLPVLAEIVAATQTGDLHFLVTDYGQPFTAAGFGGKFRDWCNQANLPHCTAHGLRKAGATIAAENGATDRMLMAMYGWTSSQQATTYTAAADRKKLAGEAGKLLGKG
jgi:integrase